MRYAYRDTDCAECVTLIAQDDPIYFGRDGERWCPHCAARAGIVCPQCNDQKRDGYALCAKCSKRPKGAQLI